MAEANKVPSKKKPWYRVLYVQVLMAVVLGVFVGAIQPKWAVQLKPLGDGFINLVKMMIAPIIFCTIVHGIASVGDLKRLGRVGVKSLIYFEVVSTIALVIGLLVVNLLEPGVGITPEGKTFHVDPQQTHVAQGYVEKSKSMNVSDFLLHIIPSTFLSPFVSGDLLQVLFVSILIACALVGMGKRGAPILYWIEQISQLFFSVMQIVVKAAPIGAFGAMGYAVGAHGIGTLKQLLALMAGFYLTALLFIVLVLGGILRYCGISIFRFLVYLKDELLLVLGTSSSETALPGLMSKMEQLGCKRSTVGLVVPTGYSFNLDGTNIYMAMATVFLAQATNTPLDAMSQVSLLLIAMLTSKGASGVTGAGFVTLAATLKVVPAIPIESLALLVGIDRFMSECRAITNFIGNGVATVAVSRWEGEVTPEQLKAGLSQQGHSK